MPGLALRESDGDSLPSSALALSEPGESRQATFTQ